MQRLVVAEVETRDLRRGRLFAILAFVGPLLLYVGTTSTAVQFDDCAQFVLCAREGSAAHPPGFPLWVALANLWLAPFGFLDPVTALSAFVSVCAAGAVTVLYWTFEALLVRVFDDDRVRAQSAALVGALVCATGATVWQWSNTVEIYSLQLLAVAIALYGTVRGRGSWTAIGLGIGLANHHVTTVLLIPFLPWLGAFARRVPLRAAARDLLAPLGAGVGIAALAYLMMMLRAGGDVRFSFGEPSTVSRLWHHLSGGFFGDSMFREGVDYAGRASVLSMVLVRHVWLFAVPLVIGTCVAWRRARPTLWFAVGYAAVLFSLQFGRMHTPNMDAGLLPALAVLGALVAIGCYAVGTKRLLLLACAGLVVQVWLNGNACNRRGYAAGDAVLLDLDASAPDRSIVLLTNWELQTLSLLAREERDFRPDLIVVPSNLKGTHRDLLERHYPEFHRAMRTEYDSYLAAVAAVDPDYVYSDYFTIGTADEHRTFTSMIHRVLAVATDEKRAVVCDRSTLRFLLEAEIVDPDAVTPCGLLYSIGPPTELRAFPQAAGWLAHPFLTHDLCAQALLRDYRSTAKQAVGYFRFRGRTDLAAITEPALQRIEAAWATYAPGKPAPRQSP